MLKKRIFFGVGAVICFLFFIAFIIMLSQQSYLVGNARQRFYNQKITDQQQLLKNNLDLLIADLTTFSKFVSIAEIFTRKSVVLEDFPNASLNGARSVRFTDNKGRILYSSVNTQEFNQQISQTVLNWSERSDNKSSFLFLNQDTLVGIQKYQNPYLMDTFGYIAVEFAISSLLQQTKILNYYIRIINDQRPIIVLSDTQNINIELASILSLKYTRQPIPARYGAVFEIPSLSQVIYYVGNDFYIPPILTTISILIFLLGMVLLMLFYKKENNEDQTHTEYSSKISQLIQDIETGNNYKENQADNMLHNASSFGIISDSEYTNDDQVPEYDVMISPDPFDEKIEFDPFEDKFLEPEDQEDNILEPEDQEDNILEPEDQEDNILEPEDQEDNILEIEDQMISPDERLSDQESLQYIIPLEETNDKDINNIYIPHYSLGNFRNIVVQKYTDDLAPLLETYDISHYAIAEVENNLYIFNDDSFGAQFIIDQDDVLFQEVLSKGHALSLFGNLTESEYLENLFSHDLLSTFNELYIRPIMDQDKVVAVVVLTRDKDTVELSHAEKKDLLMNHN